VAFFVGGRGRGRGGGGEGEGGGKLCPVLLFHNIIILSLFFVRLDLTQSISILEE